MRWAARKSHFKLNWAFRVIQGHPYWCRHSAGIQNGVSSSCTIMSALFLKLTTIWRQENCKFVDLNHPNPVWWQFSEKSLRTSTNNLYCQTLSHWPTFLSLIAWHYVYYFWRGIWEYSVMIGGWIRRYGCLYTAVASVERRLGRSLQVEWRLHGVVRLGENVSIKDT